MRSTLTLDADVAADLHRLQRATGRSWKETVNGVARAGVVAFELQLRSRQGQPVRRTKSVDLGGTLVSDISNVHEVLSVVDGDFRR